MRQRMHTDCKTKEGRAEAFRSRATKVTSHGQLS